MKKTLLSLLCLASVAGMTTSCQSDNEEFKENQKENTGLTLVAENPGVTNNTRSELSFDEKGMPQALWSDCYDIYSDAYPEEYIPDFLYASFEGIKGEVRFKRNTVEPSEKAVFKEFKYNPDRGLKEMLAESGSKNVYFVKNAAAGFYEIVNYEFDELNGILLGFSSKPNTFSSFDDVLVSKPIAAEEIINNDGRPIQPSFKRLTGIIRINLIPDEGIDFTAGGTDKIRYVSLTTNNADGEGEKPDFGGPFRINIEKGALERIGDLQYASGIQVTDATIPTLVPGEGGYPAYMTAVPISLKQGDKINLHCRWDNYSMNIEKVITVPEGGIEIKAGEITTFNIRIKTEDIRYPIN